ncbi:MAG: family 20 glycosylhydrolase [Bacteroidia bacterium]|nr:family 20 glycosylhydrolase [Bacteroidia bacterium]
MNIAELNLLPLPASVNLREGKFRLDHTFSLTITGTPHDRIYGAATRFLRRLDGRTGLFFAQGFLTPLTIPATASFKIEVQKSGEINLHMEESYHLSVDIGGINLSAPSDIGAIRGLETLLQLLEADEEGWFFPGVTIDDKPRFPWRGLLIDVARHFLPVEKIKQNIDGLAAVKMNVLHFHLTDDQGFRIETECFPKLHEWGSDGFYYTQIQIKEIVQYAADRGIRVVPEIGVPSHATAILTAYPEYASAPGPYSIERKAGIMNPTLDPTREETYEFLEKLFTEVSALFPDEYFHIGGDENEGKQWDANPDIQRFMQENGIADNAALQTWFNRRLLKILTGLGKKMMGWDEILQPDLPKDAVIHSWRGKESLYEAAKNGYNCVLSNGYYIDLALPASSHYPNDPLPADQDLPAETAARILGGEATMWSELVTPLTIDSRIWPRTAAIAERLWSSGTVTDIQDMYRRLDEMDLRLEELGLQHNTARDVIMRSLCRGKDITPLKTLVDVIEPMKIYTRNPEGELYRMFSPFTLLADAARPDAKVARLFREAVVSYLREPHTRDRMRIMDHLRMWKSNHELLLPLIRQNPALAEAEEISRNLSKIASIGLTAMEGSIRDRAAGVSVFEEARKQGGRTELQVVDAIEQLVLNLPV